MEDDTSVEVEGAAAEVVMLLEAAPLSQNSSPQGNQEHTPGVFPSDGQYIPGAYALLQVEFPAPIASHWW